MRHNTIRATAAVLAMAAGAAASAAVISWNNAAGGPWNTATNWSPVAIPGAADDAIVNLAGSYTISIPVGQSAGTLSIGNASATVEINNASSLTVGTLGNNGLIVVNPSGGGNGTSLVMSGPSTISGTGTIRLNATSGILARANLTYANAADVVTQAATHTIAGMGNVFTSINNLGTVSADQAGSIMSLSLTPKANSGTMRAINTGQLDINGVTVTQTGAGQLRADNGTVRLLGGAAVTGGFVRALNGGTVTVDAGNATVSGVTIEGPLNIRNAASLSLAGGITNNGLLTVNSDGGGSGTSLTAVADATISGNGTVRLNATADVAARANLTYDIASRVVTNGPSHTIAGRGNVFTALINNGTVTADEPGTMVLSLQPKTNASLMSATGTGELQINGVAVTQTGPGRLSANGGTLTLINGATIVGGLVEAINGGLTQVGAGNGTFTGPIAVAGPVSINNAVALNWSGVITNSGTITVNPQGGGSATFMQLNGGNGTIQGSGEIVLNATASVPDRAYLWYNNAANVMTQAAGHTIRGSGNIYTNLVNNGLVSADVDGQTLQLRFQPKQNNATMQAIGGGNLQIDTITVTQGSGAKISANGGTLTLISGAAIAGGLVEAINGGLTQIGSGNGTFTGPIAVAGPVSINNAVALNWSGTLTNSGTITVNPQGGGSATFMQLNGGNGTIQGSGEIVLNATSGVPDRAYLWYDNAGNVMTQGAGHTIRGSGNIYTNLVNNGLVSADVDGQTLQLRFQPKQNNATMQAIGGGNLQIDSITVTQGSGAKISANGGTLTLINGAAIAGGLVEAINGGLTQVGAGNGTFTGPIAVAGPVSINNAQTLNWSGTLTNNGTITVNPQGAGNLTLMQLNGGNGTIQGSGKIVLNATQGVLDRAYLWYNNAGNVLTNAAGHTIAGEGNVYTALINQGIIAPGDASAASGETGNLTMRTNPKTFAAGGQLRFQLAGAPAANDYDRLTGDAALTFGGGVSISEINGYSPTIGDVFPIIRTTGAVSGTFDFIGQLSSTPGAVYRLAYRSNGVDLVVTCVADLTADVLLNFADVSSFITAFTSGDLTADVNNDGFLNFADVQLFVGLFSQPCM